VLLPVADEMTMPKPEKREIVPGLWREERCGGRLIVYTLGDALRHYPAAASVDAWLDDFQALLAAVPAGRNIYLLLHVQTRWITFSAHFRSRLEHLTAAIQQQGLTGYSAVVLPDTIMSRAVMTFIHLLGRRTRIEQRFFVQYPAAEEWLMRHLRRIEVDI
jgi:hypothetical protein